MADWLKIKAEYLAGAGQGVSRQQATNIGGTGNCPLTDYADAYDVEHRLALQARQQADALWTTVSPLLKGMLLDHCSVIELYYNAGVPREDVPELIKRSAAACERMHREALAGMEAARIASGGRQN